MRLLQDRQQRAAQGELAKRVAAALRLREPGAPTLPPVEIEIDNDASDRYTVLQISAPDTPGFLYEFTNALALSGVHISQVFVISAGARVRDTLFVTDSRGEKIKTDAQQRELRAATVLIKHFTHLLPRSPNPESALIHFHEYLGELFSRPSWPDELASLERPEVLDALGAAAGRLRVPVGRLPAHAVREPVPGGPRRRRARPAEDRPSSCAPSLVGALAQGSWRDALNDFKDREMFRIDMRHILGQAGTFDAFSAELTDLVEVVLSTAIEQVEREFDAQYGRPLDEEGAPGPLQPRRARQVRRPGAGLRLRYRVDVRLRPVRRGRPRRDDRAAGHSDAGVLSRSWWWRRRGPSTRAREGIFQIDLQLRPYGKAGSLAVSLDAFRRYFAPAVPPGPTSGRRWSSCARSPGTTCLGPRAGAAARRLHLHRRAVRRRGHARHARAAAAAPGRSRAGSTRSSARAGWWTWSTSSRACRWRTATGTRASASRTPPPPSPRSPRAGIISGENAARLKDALTFLLQLINALRMVRGNSKDLTVPPVASEEFAFLARRLGYGHDAERLNVTLNETMGWVQRLEGRLLG